MVGAGVAEQSRLPLARQNYVLVHSSDAQYPALRSQVARRRPRQVRLRLPRARLVCVRATTYWLPVCDSLATYETLRGKDATFTQMVFLPIIPYLIWQVLYLIKVQGSHQSVRHFTFAYQLIRLTA